MQLTPEQSEVCGDNIKLIYRVASELTKANADMDYEELVSFGSVVFCEVMAKYDQTRGSVASYCLPILRVQLWRHVENLRAVKSIEDGGDVLPMVPDCEPEEAAKLSGWRLLTPQERGMVEIIYGITGTDPTPKPSRRQVSVERAAELMGVPRSQAKAVLHNAICKLRRAADRAES